MSISLGASGSRRLNSIVSVGRFLARESLAELSKAWGADQEDPRESNEEPQRQASLGNSLGDQRFIYTSRTEGKGTAAPFGVVPLPTASRRIILQAAKCCFISKQSLPVSRKREKRRVIRATETLPSRPSCIQRRRIVPRREGGRGQDGITVLDQ